jgi:hypothetical protein
MAGCTGIRALARQYKVTDKVISNRLSRLSRQAIGTMAALRPSQQRSEALVVDGFESFVRSQYSPNNTHHLIGAQSQYVYACDLAHLRRKGRMREDQKRKRQHLEKRDSILPSEIQASFDRICHAIQDLPWSGVSLVLHSDKKKEYQAVLEANKYLGGRLQHLSTSSRKARTFRNPLWPVNYYDRELRKDQASQVRETTRWSKESNHFMERMYTYAAYHNFFKPYRIKGRDGRTHAEVAGFDINRVRERKERFFRERYFFSKVHFNISEWLVWLRAYRTPFCRGYPGLPAYVTCQDRVGALLQAA